MSLLRAISSIKPKKARQWSTSNFKETVLRTLENWVAELHRRYSPLPPGTSVAFFRLLFPEQDISRKYGLQETKLAKYLSEILSPHFGVKLLQDWQKADSLGCLGAQVLKVAEETSVVSQSSALTYFFH